MRPQHCPAGAVIKSVNTGLKDFPRNTRHLNGSGIYYSFSGGYYVYFSPGKSEIIFGLENDLYKLVDPSKSYLPNLAQPAWVIRGITLWGLTHLPVSKTFGLTRVPQNEDGHQLITSEALASMQSLQVYFGQNPSSYNELPLQVSYQDVPGPETAINANLMSLIHGNIGDTDELLARHGLRPLYVDIENSTVILGTQEQTQMGIRQSMEFQLDGLLKANQALAQTTPQPALTAQTLTERLADLTLIETALQKGDNETALRALEDFREYCDYGQMRDFSIPDENRAYLLAHPKYIRDLAIPHLSLLRMIKEVQTLSLTPDQNPESRAKAVAIFRTVLRYFRPEIRDSLAAGFIANLAERDLHLASALHLAQDSRAHCNTWTLDTDADGLGDVCTESVGVNSFGIGPIHSGTQDDLEGVHGAQNQKRGMVISQEILALTQIQDADAFEIQKQIFLNKYWPAKQAVMNDHIILPSEVTD